MTTLLRAGLLASTLLLAGCLRSTTTVDVDETGGGEATVVLAIDPVRTAELAAETGGIAAAQLSDANSAELCSQFRQLALPDNLPPSATVTDYDADGLCGHQIEFPFADGDELATTLDQVTGGQAGDLDSFVLASEDDDWVFSAPLGGLSTALESAAGAFPPAVVDTALDNTAITYELNLPGTAVEGANNATEVEGGTFRWIVDAASPPETLMARSTLGGGGLGGSTLIGVVLVALGVVAALGLGALVLTRRRGGTPSPATAAPGPAGVPTAAAGPTAAAPSTPSAPEAPAPDAEPSLDPASLPSPGQPPDAAPGPAPDLTSLAPPAAGDDGPLDAGSMPEGTEPRWDPVRRAWVADHETEGLLVHDEKTGMWHRA